MSHCRQKLTMPTLVQSCFDLFTCQRGSRTWFDPEGKRRILPNVYRYGTGQKPTRLMWKEA